MRQPDLNENDRVFVGQWYIAWIDETGFYGKVNGLWALNGDLEHLNFVLFDGDRPVNSLIVGEQGNGTWPKGYMGSEHIEFPNATPEADDCGMTEAMSMSTRLPSQSEGLPHSS